MRFLHWHCMRFLMLSFQTFIEGLTEKLFTKTVILVATEKEDKSLNNEIFLLKQMSGSVIKISVALEEKILGKIIENLNGSPAIFIVTGENASKFSAQVIMGQQITTYHNHYSSKVFSQPVLSAAQFWLVEVNKQTNKTKK